MAFSLNSSNVFYSVSAPINGYPFSLVGWFRVPDTGSFTSLMGLVSFSTGARCDLYFAGDGAKEAVAKTVYGISGSAYSTSPMIPGHWHHLTAVFASDDERTIYLDGGNAGVNNENIAIGALGFFYFGNFGGPDLIDVADVSLVQAAVSEEQAAALAKGYPILASPNSHDVIAYQDCIRQAMRPGLGPDLTMTGTPTVVEHPRMMFSKGGYASVMPVRVPGPFRVEERLYRSLSAEQGQLSIAGVVSTNSILPGEVVS